MIFSLLKLVIEVFLNYILGVIQIPEVNFHEISQDDKFVIIGSDGVFEFLTNHEIMNLVIPFY